ncbi:MAG TPA: type II secretion system protein GspG [Blastocatellia bacterium]|nr:type II secretion system protein GspG [Blastocatellia bacterium]
MQAHFNAARAVDTTRRFDPTTVFLPEVHEALAKRARRRKRLLVAGLIAVLLIVAGLFAFDSIHRRRQLAERAQSRERMAQRELAMLADGLERFKADVGRYPTEQEGLASLTRRPSKNSSVDVAQAGDWMGPYIEGVFEVDPWGNDYVYRLVDNGAAFELISYGPQGDSGAGKVLRAAPPREILR